MEDESEKPFKGEHVERFNGCRVVYWRAGEACGALDEWTEAEVEAHCVVSFKVKQKAHLDKLIWFAEAAHAEGEKARAAKIKTALMMD